MKLKRLLFSAVTAIALAATTVPATATFAATSAALSADYAVVCPTESNNNVDFKTTIDLNGTAKYGDNDIVVIVEGDLKYPGNMYLKVNGSEKKMQALNTKDYRTDGSMYKTAVVFSPSVNGLSTGDKLSLYFECYDTHADGSNTVSITAYQKVDGSTNREKFDSLYRVAIDSELASICGTSSSSSTTVPDDGSDEEVDDDEAVVISEDDGEVEAISSGDELGERAVIDESSIKMYSKDFSVELANESGEQVLWEVTNIGTGKTTTERGYCYHAFDDIYKRGRAVYKVRAHFIEGNTAWSDPIYVVPCATFDCMKKSYVKKDRLTLKWDKVEGATGYEIFMASNWSKNFKKIATTKSTSKTIKVNLKSKSRQFVVRTVYEGQAADEKVGTVQYYSVKYI